MGRNTEHLISAGSRYTLGKALRVELGLLLSQTNREGERASRGRAGGLIPPALPSPAVPLAATFAGGASAAPVPGRAPAPAALRAALPGETTCCRFGCFSAFRWLFHLPPRSTPTGITAAPAARAEILLPSFYRGDAAVPRRGWERGPPAERTGMTGTAVIPVALREDEPKGEIVPHLGPQLRPGAGAGAAEPALHTPLVPRYQPGGRREATAKTNTASFRKRHHLRS